MVAFGFICIKEIVFSTKIKSKQENVTNEVKSIMAFHRNNTHYFIIFVLTISLAS